MGNQYFTKLFTRFCVYSVVFYEALPICGTPTKWFRALYRIFIYYTVYTALLCRYINWFIEKSTNINTNSLSSIAYRYAQKRPVWSLQAYECNYLISWIFGKLKCTVILCMQYIIDFMGLYMTFKNYYFFLLIKQKVYSL